MAETQARKLQQEKEDLLNEAKLHELEKCKLDSEIRALIQ